MAFELCEEYLIELELMNALVANGFEGATVWYDGVKRTEGYVVGNNNTSRKFDTVVSLADMFEAMTVFMVVANKLEGIGAWVDDAGTLYLDHVVHVIDVDEAYALARLNGEKAIYCIGTNECFDVI
jgi:hypothetical protein